ncbi:MAG TPA: nucleoside monophosphate kinase, partial [Candidatus Eisenbacteria bacterium]|nr:nucleoside monophosphate kinase [Candidatus Eisenbacteria bacterium]
LYDVLRRVQQIDDARLLQVLKDRTLVDRLKAFRIPSEAAIQGLGQRQILAYRALLEELAKKRGEKFEDVLARQNLVLNVNEEVAESVLKDFEENNFYGFDRSRVTFLIQPIFEGFRLEEKAVVQVPESAALPFGHGYATTQLKFPDAFTLNEEGQPVPLAEPVLDRLIAQDQKSRFIIASHRVNDLTKVDVDQVVELDHLALSLSLLEKGHGITVTLVGNPNKQKGGNNARFIGDVRSFLIETSNSKGSKALDQKLTAAAAAGAPYNAFRLLSTPQAYKQLLDIGIRYNLRFKEGLFYLESVTGDLTQIPESNSTSIHQRGDLIHDFKQLSNLPEALEFLAAQDKRLAKPLPARLAAELVALTEDQKNFLREKRVIAVVAAPFAGKGTHLKFLEDQLNEGFTAPEDRFVRLEMGDYFRGAYLVSTGKLKADAPNFAEYQAVARLIQNDFPTDFDLMIAGKLVSNAAAEAVVNFVLSFPRYAAAKGILLDGYPRANEQLDAVEEGRLRLGADVLKIGLYLVFELPKATLLRRAEVAAGREGRVDGGKTAVRLETFEQVTQPVIDRLKSESKDVIVVNTDDKPGTLEESIAAVRREELIPAIEAKRAAAAENKGARLASPSLSDEKLREIGLKIALHLAEIAPSSKTGSSPVLVPLLFAAPGVALSAPSGVTLAVFTLSPTPAGVRIDAKQVPVAETTSAAQAVLLEQKVFTQVADRPELERSRVEARAAALTKLSAQAVTPPVSVEPAGFNAQAVLSELVRGANEALARGLLFWQKGQGANLWNSLYRNFDQAIAGTAPGSIIPIAFPLEAFFDAKSGRIISVDFSEMVGMLNAMGRTRRVRFALALTYRGEALNPQSAALVQRAVERLQRDPRDPVEVTVLRLRDSQSVLAAVVDLARTRNNDQVSTLGPVIIGANVKDVKNPGSIFEELLLQSLRSQGFNSKVGVFGVAVSDDPDYVVPAASLFAAGIKAISPDMPIPSAFVVFFKEQDIPGLGRILIVQAIRIDQELRTLLLSIQATQSAA